MSKKTNIPQANNLLPDETISHILHNDYKSYATYVVRERAIPHFADGLKPVQRKCLAAAIRFASKEFKTVSAISGYCKGEFEYEHGEPSANGAIIIMNQDFMQAMPYLDSSESQYGWLYDKEAGHPRYISTKTTKWVNMLFLDEQELVYKSASGAKCEPQNYLPILPMTLLNGTNGIAVGYASSFRMYNPLEIFKCVNEYLKTGVLRNYNLTPFYKGQQGVWSFWNNEFEHCGTYQRVAKNLLTITGLPISTTIKKFEAFLNNLIDDGHVIKWSNTTSKSILKFDIVMNPEFLDKLENDNQIARFFQLIYRMPQNNLTVIMPTGETKRFDSPIEYIKEFVNYRLLFYTKRKNRQLNDIQNRIKYLNDVIRFIYMVINNEIEFRNKIRKVLETELALIDICAEVLNIHIYQLTADNIIKHQTEIAELESEYALLLKTSERDLYLRDLNNIKSEVYKDYYIEPVLNLKNEKLLRIS